jgi:hypothetical protein
MAKKKIVQKKEYPSPVAVQLISHLSEGAYTTFAKAVKELVINSFDANANRVNLDFGDDFTKLTIYDDGNGISSDKFKSEFLRIANPKKRAQQRNRRFKRPIIGRFGIGFLSSARLCEKVTICSKTKGSNRTIVREIPLKHFFDEENQAKNLQDQYYFYSLPSIKEDSQSNSYTRIVLENLREDVRNDLTKKQSKAKWDSTDDLSGLERFRFELGILLPVRYQRAFPVKGEGNNIIKKAKMDLNDFNFKVFLDGAEILKPICLGEHYFKDAKWNYGDKKTLPSNEFDIIPIETPLNSTIKFSGYLYNQSKQIQPAALRGILLRVNHVGIKGYNKSLFEYSGNIGPILPQISGEVFLSSDFEKVLTLDKDDFKEDHPLYKELVGYIHEAVKDVATKSRERSDKKKTGTRKKSSPKIKDLNFKTQPIKDAKKILGKKKLQDLYFPNLDITIKRRVGNLKRTITNLIGKTLHENEGSYLNEALDCFKADCPRGCIVMAWNAGIYRIYRKIEKDLGFDKLQDAIDKLKRIKRYGWLKSQLKDCETIEDLKEYNEKVLCLLTYKLELMEEPVAQLFFRSLGAIRDNNTHPTGHKPSEIEVLLMVQSVLDRILNNENFKITNG